MAYGQSSLAPTPSPGAPRAALEALRHVRTGGIGNVANMPERTRRCTVRHSRQRLKDREADGVRRLALTLHTKGAELHLGMRRNAPNPIKQGISLRAQIP